METFVRTGDRCCYCYLKDNVPFIEGQICHNDIKRLISFLSLTLKGQMYAE